MTDHTLVYNRPARVRARYTDVAKVQYLDTNTVDYVPTTEVTADD